jgi:hybrid cluster-associated redox disulfide protein
MTSALTMLTAFVALGTTVVLLYRQRSLRQTLRDTQRRLYLTQARLNELETTVQNELQRLNGLLRRRSGGPLVEASMKIADAIAIDPRVRNVLAQFHLGGCSSCAIDEEQTIEQVAMSYGIDLDRLMAALTAVSDGQEGTARAPQHGRLLQLSEF